MQHVSKVYQAEIISRFVFIDKEQKRSLPKFGVKQFELSLTVISCLRRLHSPSLTYMLRSDFMLSHKSENQNLSNELIWNIEVWKSKAA